MMKNSMVGIMGLAMLAMAGCGRHHADEPQLVRLNEVESIVSRQVFHDGEAWLEVTISQRINPAAPEYVVGIRETKWMNRLRWALVHRVSDTNRIVSTFHIRPVDLNGKFTLNREDFEWYPPLKDFPPVEITLKAVHKAEVAIGGKAVAAASIASHSSIGRTSEPVPHFDVPRHNYLFSGRHPVMDAGSWLYSFKAQSAIMLILAKHGFGVKESDPHRFYFYTIEDCQSGEEIIHGSTEETETIKQLEKIKLRDKAVAHDVDHLIECLQDRHICINSFQWEEFSKVGDERRAALDWPAGGAYAAPTIGRNK